MLSHLLPVKILPQQNETYRVPFSFEGQNIFTREGETSSYYLNANGVETANNSYCISDYIEVEPLKRYIIACQPVLTAGRYHCWYDSSKTFIESDHWGQESFIAPQNAKYVRLSYRTTFPATDMHIEVGTITTGVLDLKTGVLTTDYGYISDLSKYTTQIQNATYTNLYRTIMISGAYNTASSERNQFIRCSHYQPSTGTSINNNMPNGSCLMVGGSSETSRGYFTFRNNNYDNDLAGWQTTLPGIQVWYRLRNTLTYQLTPADIKLLQGYNKITSNAQQIDYQYRNDKNEIVNIDTQPANQTVVTIEDGVYNRSLAINTQVFQLRQRTHGYGKAWPPGCGVNVIDDSIVYVQNASNVAIGNNYDFTIPLNGTYLVQGWYDAYVSSLYIRESNDTAASNIWGLTSERVYFRRLWTLSDGLYRLWYYRTAGVELSNLIHTQLSLYTSKNLFDAEDGLGSASSLKYFPINVGTGTFTMSTTCPLNNNNGANLFFLAGNVTSGSSTSTNGVWSGKTRTVDSVDGYVTVASRYTQGIDPRNYNTQVERGSSATTYETFQVPDYSPYANISPLIGETESVITVEGTPIPDSESERRLKAITRPVFQWDFGLKLKFEGYTFADGTLCQFDNKLTTFSQNEYIVNNECTIPASLLDENCQGDIVAHINVSGNDYDVVVYEVYIPVIKRAKPENFLRPAIDLPQAVVASFADGADGVPLEKLNLPLLPKQDLNGYAYPWVGGGGKNKANITTNTDAQYMDVTKYTADEIEVTNLWSGSKFGAAFLFNAVSGTSYTFSVSEYTIDGTSSGLQMYLYSDRLWGTAITTLSIPSSTRRNTWQSTYTGQILVGIYVGSGKTIKCKQFQIEEGSTATDYAPYSNICPITGHTSASVVRAGRNLWPHGDLSGTGNSGGRDFNPNLPAVNTKYTVSGVFTSSDTDATTNNFAIQFTGGSNYLQMTRGARSSKSSTRTNEAIRQARLYASSSSAQSAGDTFTGTDIQFEIGTSASSYEPYKGEVFTIPFTHEGPNVFTTEGATLDRYINANGQEASSTNYRITAYIPVEPNKRYVFDANTTRFSTSVYHAYFDANKQLITSVHAMQEGLYIPSNIYYVRLSYRKDEVPTDFHISIGTVPHGTLDIKSGILIQDYAFVSDMASMIWRVNSTTYPTVYRTDYYLGNIYGPTTASGRIRGFSCSCYKPMDEDHAGSGSNSTPYAMMRYSGALFIRNDDYSNDAASFKASLAGQQVVYELDRESPAIYQLTPTEVKTLLGYNNIWADTGEVEVSYYPDPYLHFET